MMGSRIALLCRQIRVEEQDSLLCPPLKIFFRGGKIGSNIVFQFAENVLQGIGHVFGPRRREGKSISRAVRIRVLADNDDLRISGLAELERPKDLIAIREDLCWTLPALLHVGVNLAHVGLLELLPEELSPSVAQEGLGFVYRLLTHGLLDRRFRKMSGKHILVGRKHRLGAALIFEGALKVVLPIEMQHQTL